MVEIETVKINKYRSFIDSGEINTQSKITTLVGPNEAGKSNLLEALQKFRTDKDFDNDDLSFYIDDTDMDTEEIPMVTIKMSNIPLEILHQRMRRVSSEEDINADYDSGTITKYYDGSYSAELENHPELINTINEERQQQLQGEVREARNQYKEIMEIVREESDADIDLLHPHFLGRVFENNTENIQNIRPKLERMENQINEVESKVDDEILSQIDEELKRSRFSLKKSKNFSYPAARLIVQNVYNTAFKEGADLIKDEATIDSLQNGSTDTFYSDILNFAGIDPDQYYEMDSKERFDRKRNAANQLEEGFNDYWPREDDVKFELSFGGDAISLHISDESGSTDLATHRSTGFRHFLSFYIRLIAASGNELEDNLLLLDGPGIHLHPEGQIQLKEALENLAENNQIIYSTHSPFMIDANHVERIRILRQDTSDGTQVLSNLDEAAQSETEVDVLAPVRTSIGANFADSLFASSANILVEGYTDKQYLEAFSEYFRRSEERESIDYKTNIITVDGSKADYLAKILEAEGYEYVILLDDDKAGETRKESLIERGIKPNRIHLLSDSISWKGQEEDITIEDLFSNDFFARNVAEVHDSIEVDDIDEVIDESPNGIVRSITNRMSELEGREQIPNSQFQKGKISDRISEHIVNSDQGEQNISEGGIDNFQRLIQDLNSTLKS